MLGRAVTVPTSSSRTLKEPRHGQELIHVCMEDICHGCLSSLHGLRRCCTLSGCKNCLYKGTSHLYRHSHGSMNHRCLCPLSEEHIMMQSVAHFLKRHIKDPFPSTSASPVQVYIWHDGRLTWQDGKARQAHTSHQQDQPTPIRHHKGYNVRPLVRPGRQSNYGARSCLCE